MKKLNSDVADKILIIEDEKDLCYLLSAALRKNNIDSQCACSIHEARGTLTNINPSIVFLDNHLPDGYGSDFIATVKQLLPKAKIIMITAYDSPSDIKLAFKRGADYFISKPFNTHSIKSALDIVKTEPIKQAV